MHMSSLETLDQISSTDSSSGAESQVKQQHIYILFLSSAASV